MIALVLATSFFTACMTSFATWLMLRMNTQDRAHRSRLDRIYFAALVPLAGLAAYFLTAVHSSA